MGEQDGEVFLNVFPCEPSVRLSRPCVWVRLEMVSVPVEEWQGQVEVVTGSMRMRNWTMCGRPRGWYSLAWNRNRRSSVGGKSWHSSGKRRFFEAVGRWHRWRKLM